MDNREVFDDCGSWLTSTGFLYSRAGNSQHDQGQYDKAIRVLASKSATCIISSDTFRQAHRFDAHYFILGEETDLAWRVWLLGKDVWYLPEAKSWHAFGTSLKPKAQYYTNRRIHFHGCKNYIQMLCTNLSLSSLWRILPIHLAIWFFSSFCFLLRGQPGRAWLILQGMFWCVRNQAQIRQKRRRVQKGRKVRENSLMEIIKVQVGPRYYLDRLVRYISQGLHG